MFLGNFTIMQMYKKQFPLTILLILPAIRTFRMNEDIPLHRLLRDVIRRVDNDVPEGDLSDRLDLLLAEQTIVRVLEPKSVGVAKPLKLFLDDLAEEFARSAALRFEHAADKQVDVVQVALVQRVKALNQLKSGEGHRRHDNVR